MFSDPEGNDYSPAFIAQLEKKYGKDAHKLLGMTQYDWEYAKKNQWD